VKEGQFGVGGKSLAEIGGEAIIFFDGSEGVGASEEGIGEDSESGADFDDGIGGLDFGGIEQDVEDVAVDEKILAEDARGVEVQLGEQGANFGGVGEIDGFGHFGDFIRLVGLVSDDEG